MPSQFKVNLNFRLGPWRWQEGYYWTSQTHGILQCAFDSIILVQLRRNFLSKNVMLGSYSVVAVNDAGEGLQTLPPYKSCSDGTGVGVLEGTCNDPWGALITHWHNQAFSQRATRLFRGFPSDQLCILGQDDWKVRSALNGSAFNNFNLFAQYLTQNYLAYSGLRIRPDCTPIPNTGVSNGQCGQWSFRGCNYTTGRAARKPITGVQATEDGQVLVKLDSDGAIVNGSKIHLHGTGGPGTSGLNGNQTVNGNKTTDAPIGYWPLLLNRADPNCVFAWNGLGTWWQCTNLLWRPAWVEECGFTKRKTGVGGRTRGRARKRKSKCQRCR